MNIYLRELKVGFKSLLIWILIIGLLLLMARIEFQAYADNPEMLAVLDAMPPGMLEAFSVDAFNLTTLEGFYGMLAVYFNLMSAVAAAMWGSGVIAKEERDKTVEFSLVLPVSRARVVTAKALAALTHLALLVLATWVIALAATQPYAPSADFYHFLGLEMQAMFLIGLIFLALGLLLGCGMRRYQRAGATAIALLLTTYAFSIASGLDERLEFLKYFSPFEYFEAASLLHEGRVDGFYLSISLALIVVMVAVGYWRYNRRDLAV